MFLYSIPTEKEEDDVFIICQVPGSKTSLTSHVRVHHKEEDCSVIHITNQVRKLDVIFYFRHFIFQGIFHYSKEEWLAPAEGLEVAKEDEEGGGGLELFIITSHFDKFFNFRSGSKETSHSSSPLAASLCPSLTPSAWDEN